jgi:hypothetical protein
MVQDEGKWWLQMVGEPRSHNLSRKQAMRLDQLEAKMKLTQEEFEEMRELQGLGGGEEVVEVGELRDMGVTDPLKALEYMQSSDQHADRAFQAGFYLEAISAKFNKLDFGLRAYLVKNIGKPVSPKLMFGQMVKEAENKTTLDRDLVRRLRDFSDRRAAGTHRLFLGQADYTDLRDLYLNADALANDLADAIALD